MGEEAVGIVVELVVVVRIVVVGADDAVMAVFVSAVAVDSATAEVVGTGMLARPCRLSAFAASDRRGLIEETQDSAGTRLAAGVAVTDALVAVVAEFHFDSSAAAAAMAQLGCKAEQADIAVTEDTVDSASRRIADSAPPAAKAVVALATSHVAEAVKEVPHPRSPREVSKNSSVSATPLRLAPQV